MQKILITGSEGFVGQHLIEVLKDTYLCIGLYRTIPPPQKEGVEYVQGDILDAEQISAILKKYSPDYIVHLAGIAKTWGNDAKEVFNINFFGTLNIYTEVLKLKSKFNPKIIFISSAEVYGKTTRPENISEDDLLMPINVYGVSKLAADRLSFQYAKSNNLNIVILRPFPHIGPGQGLGFFVPDMTSQLVELEKGSENTLLVGNLDATRDYTDVRDVVEAYKRALETDLPSGEVYNICSGNGIKIKDLLDKLLSLTNKKINLKEDPQRLRSVDLPVFVGSNKKFKDATGWNPKIPIDQTLKDVIDYWREKNG